MAEEELLERALRFGDLRLSTFIQEYLNPLVGVVSLSTDLSVPTMWTHYAMNTGIVVGYDTEVLRNLGFELRQVSYTEIAPVYEPTKGDVIQLQFADRERMEQDTRAGRTLNGTPILGTVELTHLGADWPALSRLLFVKGPSWEYEREVRLLVDLQGFLVRVGRYADGELLSELLGQLDSEAMRRLVVYAGGPVEQTEGLPELLVGQTLHPNEDAARAVVVVPVVHVRRKSAPATQVEVAHAEVRS